MATFHVRLTVLIHSLFSKTANDFFSFDFLDEHHIVYGSSNDAIHVYNFREDAASDAEGVGHLRFQLDLPPIDCLTRAATPYDEDGTVRYIQIQCNALPFRTQDPHEVSDLTPPPFHADPHARLAVFRILTAYGSKSADGTEGTHTEFDLHVPAQALLKRVAATKDARGGKAAVPWSSWCADATTTPTRLLHHDINMWHVPLHVDAYTPRRADTVEGAVGTRQAVVPDALSDRVNFSSVLCEDALFCYEVQ